MSASPIWKVYSPSGEYIGCVKDAEDAAALVALRGDGGTIRYGHRIVVWTEGSEDQPAGESYDHVANVAIARVRDLTRRQVLDSPVAGGLQ